MRELKIGMLQLHNTADTEKNIENLIEGIKDLAKRGAELVVLQELHNSLYFCQVEDVDNFNLAETISRSINRTLWRSSKRMRNSACNFIIRKTCSRSIS